MSPSLKLPKQKSDGSQLPRKQLKKLLRQEADCCRYHLLKKRKKKTGHWQIKKRKKRSLTGILQRTKQRAEAKQGFPLCIPWDKEKQRCSEKFASFYCQPFMLRMHHMVEEQVQLGADLTSSRRRAWRFLALMLMHNAVCQHCWGFIPLLLFPHFLWASPSIVLLYGHSFW